MNDKQDIQTAVEIINHELIPAPRGACMLKDDPNAIPLWRRSSLNQYLATLIHTQPRLKYKQEILLLSSFLSLGKMQNVHETFGHRPVVG